MILKHEDKKNGTMYWSADEFIVKPFYLKFKDGFKTETDNRIDDTSDVDFGRNVDEYNAAAMAVYEETGWGFTNVSFVTDTDYRFLQPADDNKGRLIAVLPKTKGAKYPVLVFSNWTWLMTDNGKTIEKLI